MGPELSLKKTMLLALVVMAVAWALWPQSPEPTDVEATARLERQGPAHAGVVVDR